MVNDQSKIDLEQLKSASKMLLRNDRNKRIQAAKSSANMRPINVKRIVAQQEEQNVASYGISHICINKKLWEDFPVDTRKLNFFGSSIKYFNKKMLPIDCSYEELMSKMGRYCKCGGKAATILNGIDLKACKKVQIYNQCPLQKMLCIRKVLNQISLPNVPMANEFYDFYLKEYHDKFIKAADTYFFLTPKAVFNGIKNYIKQIEVLPYMQIKVLKLRLLLEGKLKYKQHNKSELQSLLEKVRQICNPQNFSKFLTLLFEKSLTAMMYDVFGHQYGVGMSNEEKQYEISEMLKDANLVTLDCSGFDNSHNRYVKQPWNKLIFDLSKKYKDRLLEIDADCFVEHFAKEKSIIEYDFTVQGRQQRYCDLNIGQRLASGSVYTTLMNTFLMLLMIKFVAKKLGDKTNENSVSGDDALAKFLKKYLAHQIRKAFYSVYARKKVTFFNGLGVQLKYCIISQDPEDAIPCSLDTFVCKTCGPKLVRHFFKYIRDTFISINYNNKLCMMGVPIEYMEQLVYEGEMAWARGLEFATMVLSPLNHGIPIEKISVFLMKKMEKMIHSKESIDSDVMEKFEFLKNETDPAEKAKIIMAILKDTKYVKLNRNKYCPDCSLYYDIFLHKKYGINSDMIRPFYKNAYLEYATIDGQRYARDSRYIPNAILEKAKKKYDDYKESISGGVTKQERFVEIINELNSYYKEKIKAIPEELFTTKPTSYESRLNDLAKIVQRNETTQGCFLDWAIEKENAPVLWMIYNVKGDYKNLRPLPADFYDKPTNTYEHFEINGIKFELPRPKFELPVRHIKKAKKKACVEEKFMTLYNKASKEEKDKLVNSILDGTYDILDEDINGAKILDNQKFPPQKLDLECSIIDLRKQYITFDRIAKQTNDPILKMTMQSYMQKITERKEQKLYNPKAIKNFIYEDEYYQELNIKDFSSYGI